MDCVRCQSDRILSIMSHASDLHAFRYKGAEHEGYVPTDLFAFGGGDDLAIEVCLDCGQLQNLGEFPLNEPLFYLESLERKAEDLDEDDEGDVDPF